MKMDRAEQIKAILRRPYGRLIVPEEDGSWFGRIVEFPGCFALGDSIEEAAGNVEEVAYDWLSAVLDQGQGVPEPLDAALTEQP